MNILQIIGLAFLIGSIGAGFVWFSWGLVENLGSVVRIRKAEQLLAAQESENPEDENTEEGEKSTSEEAKENEA